MEPLYTLDARERARVRDQLAAELAAEPNVAFAYLYGSFAESRAFHDVDVGVYLHAPESPGGAPFSVALAHRLSGRLKLPVEVRVLNATPASFLYHALRGQLLVNRDDDLLTKIMEDTVRRYLDMAPLLRRSAKEAFAG